MSQLRGLAFPFRIDAAGGVEQSSDDDKIRANVVHILLTGVGERVMRRDYGGGLRQLVHDPDDPALWAIVQHQVAKAIGRMEPRVLLQKLTATSDRPTGEASITITVEYLVRRTRQVQKLSVPIGLGGI